MKQRSATVAGSLLVGWSIFRDIVSLLADMRGLPDALRELLYWLLRQPVVLSDSGPFRLLVIVVGLGLIAFGQRDRIIRQIQESDAAQGIRHLDYAYFYALHYLRELVAEAEEANCLSRNPINVPMALVRVVDFFEDEQAALGQSLKTAPTDKASGVKYYNHYLELLWWINHLGAQNYPHVDATRWEHVHTQAVHALNKAWGSHYRETVEAAGIRRIERTAVRATHSDSAIRRAAVTPPD
jgi:hypothetical protein